MIADLLEKLRSAVDEDGALSGDTRDELLRHVAAMEACAGGTGGLSGTSVEPGASLPQPVGPARSFEGLAASIQGLEAAHPEITSLVNRIATVLGNMGI